MSAGVRRSGSAGSKTSATEMWSEKLRKSGVGMSDTKVTKNGISNLKKSQTKNAAYSSTSHYLRQLVGTEKTRKPMDLGKGKSVPGTPAYKSQEEYYEETLELRKQIASLSNENSTMKSKVRRLEEDNIKKEKEIEGLLNPGKSEELRRTLTSGKQADSGAVVHSLKQKILKLEHQLKEKEASYIKLQSDMKTTKVEELRTQMETFYQEIVRLTQLKMGEIPKSARKDSVRDSAPKIKALQDTIMRMNEKNVRLTAENKALKQDLEKSLNDKAEKQENDRGHEDMTKKQLLNSIAKLEKKLDRAEADSSSLLSDIDTRKDAVEGKLSLEGSVAQKLNQLDQRESELLEEAQKQRSIIKKLKDDRQHYRKKVDEKDKEIKSLKKDIEELQGELDGFYEKDRNRTPRPSSSSRSKPPSRAPSPHGSSSKPRSRSSSHSSDSSKREERERMKKAEKLRENHAAKSIQRGWRQHKADEDENKWLKNQRSKAEKMQENRAASTIQKNWRTHRQTTDEESEEVELLQSTMRGHLSRKQQLRRKSLYEDSDVSDTELESAAELSKNRSRSNSIARRSATPPSRRGSSAGRYNKKLDSAGEEEDEDLRSHPSRRQSPRVRSPSTPYTNKRGARSRAESEEDSDDDIIVSSNYRKK